MSRPVTGSQVESGAGVAALVGPGDEPVRARSRRSRRARRETGLVERGCTVLVVALTLLLPLAGLLAPHGTREVVGAPFTSPGSSFLLGTDAQGRDVLSRVLVGLQASWFGALAVILSGVVVGATIGTVAGMLGGAVDTLLMRFTDAVLALPGTLVALLVVAAVGPGFRNVLIAVALTWWPWYARIVRGQTRALVHLPHVEAARSAGLPWWRVALIHVFPGSLGSVVVAASLDVGALLVVLASLSFIGLGSAPPAAEIGSMAADGLTYLFNAPWIALAPASALFVVAAVANLAGDHVRELAE